MGEIVRVYLGLPEHLKNYVKWISREYRTNPLSHSPGGSDIIIVYQSKKVLGYDWIKYPSSYVHRIWNDGISEIHSNFENLEIEEQLSIIKQEISCIYARKYNRQNSKTVPFEEVWNSKTSTSYPWEVLETFDHENVNNSIDSKIVTDSKKNPFENFFKNIDIHKKPGDFKFRTVLDDLEDEIKRRKNKKNNQ